ncbi:alpha/beta hydrolase family protein [Pseudoalteromonas tunicata]|uniref:alpha/beta hydrolase family protein n=1 Tax=Pseudoalteromonas tunicata TaxID=314281 RepID=UPI00273F0AD4|nr:S9 family peptidase [Pseudoalteromonas tunicata]MDP4984722.1 S9 family peptidase [Pseudoalteromonas tunicata]
MLKKLLTSACLIALSTQLHALELDKKNINYIGPIAEHSQLKPYETSQQAAILANLATELTKNSTNISIFGNELTWQSLASVKQLTVPGIQALKFSVAVERFTQGKMTFAGIDKGTLFINGEPKTLSDKSIELSLPTGEYQLLLLAEQVADWNKVTLDFTGKAEHDKVSLITESNQLSAKQLFDATTISNLSLAPDAQAMVITSIHYDDKNGDKAVKTTQLRDAKYQVRYSWDNGEASGFTWSPDNQSLIYVINGQLRSLDRKTLASKVITDKLDGASNFAFFDPQTLIFSWYKSAPSNNGLTKHYQGLEDRWSYARNSNQVYLLDITSGLIRQISSQSHSHSLEDFNADRNTVLLSRNPIDYQAPPHMLTQLVEVNLADNSETLIGQYRTFNQARYHKNGLFISAGPDFSQGAGRAIDASLLANNYDGQLYNVSFDGKKVTALSKEFDPAIEGFSVLNNKDAIVSVTEKDTKQLYLFDSKKSQFKKVNTDLDVVERFAISKDKNPQLLVTGSNASSAQRLQYINLKKNNAKTLWDSHAEFYANSHIAKLEEFNFTNQDGVEISGRVYVPHDLDQNKKYPALVYYYGGTSPVTRGFTGRYPFNLWAANGYVVYVLQPTGTTGFGQDFSAKHVNAWGEYTANDIMQGTQAFLKSYPYVDAKKVGNLGASYGGFMTMLLATKTDMFSASIAHAGISNITSYWGQGWWGYLYSGEASKNSFPWNNAELYSQRSPVFHADKVTTPLLLIHGDADTNVPKGESHNMYTALKLLNKDVELVEYKGADHQIITREQRFHWWNTMLAYFDAKLKDQPQWWDSLYPKQ